MRRLTAVSLVVLAVFGMYSMAIDAARQVPGPVGGWLGAPDGAHAPATVPGAVSYQGRLLDSSTGNPVPDGNTPVQFSIWDSATGGTQLYTSGLQAVATQDGIFSVLLGGPGYPALPASVFNGTGRWLEIQVNVDPPLAPRQQFTSVAYAMFSGGAALSNDSEQLDALDSSQFVRSDIAATKTGNLTLNNDLSVVGGDISSGTSTTVLNLDPDADGLGTVTIGDGTNSEGDDLEVFDGALCVGDAGCTFGPDGSISADAVIETASVVRVGNASTTDIDSVLFDHSTQPEALQWVDGSGNFSFTDDLSVAGNLGVNDLSTSGATTLGDAGTDLTTTTGDLRVLGGDIHSGSTTSLLINPGDGLTGSLIIGGTASQSDDVEIEDGGLCVANGGCTAPGDGHLAATNSVCVGTTACASAPPTGSGRFDTGLNLGMGSGLSAATISWNSVDGLTFFFPSMTLPEGRFAFSNDLEIDDGGLCVDAAGLSGGSCGAITNGEIKADGNVVVNAFDLAERFTPLDDDLQPGDLVAFGDGASVRRSDGTPYDNRVAGIVSGDPGFVLGWEEHGIPVALQGRVPLKVTLENGPIAPGDYLTSSSTPGHAMKATQPGPTVGIALEAFAGADGETGQVLTLVQRGDAHTASEVRELAARVDSLDGGDGEPADAAPATLDSATASGDGMSVWMFVAATGAGVVGALVAVTAIGLVRGRRTDGMAS